MRASTAHAMVPDDGDTKTHVDREIAFSGRGTSIAPEVSAHDLVIFLARREALRHNRAVHLIR